jgi:hypothetical protein
MPEPFSPLAGHTTPPRLHGRRQHGEAVLIRRQDTNRKKEFQAIIAAKQQNIAILLLQ